MGAIESGPVSIHGPAVGLPRGQQVLESLRKEEHRRGLGVGRSGSLSHGPLPHLGPAGLPCGLSLLSSLHFPFHPPANKDIELRFSFQLANLGGKEPSPNPERTNGGTGTRTQGSCLPARSIRQVSTQKPKE